MPTLAEQQAAITQKQQAQAQEAEYLSQQAQDIEKRRAEVDASQKQVQERSQQAEERQKAVKAQAGVIARMGGSTGMYSPVATAQMQADVAGVQSAASELSIKQSNLNLDIERYNQRALSYQTSSSQLKSEIDLYNLGVEQHNRKIYEFNRDVAELNTRYGALQPTSNYFPATKYVAKPGGVVEETFRAWQTGMNVTHIINPVAGTEVRPEYGVTGGMVQGKADPIEVERAKLAVDVKQLLNIDLEYSERLIPQPFTSNRPLSDESLKLITAPAGTITDVKLALKAGVITEQEATKIEYLGRGTAQFASVEEFQKSASTVPTTLTEQKGVLINKNLVGIESKLVEGKPLTPNEMHALLGARAGWLPSIYKPPTTQFETPIEINPETGKRWTAPMTPQEMLDYNERTSAPTVWWQSLSTPEKVAALFAGTGIDFGVATSYLSKRFGWGEGFDPNAFSLESAKMGDTTVNYYQITPSKEYAFAERLYNTLDIGKDAPVLERLGTGMYKAATGSFAVTAASTFAFGAGIGALSRFAPRLATSIGYGAAGIGVADIGVKTYFKDYSSAAVETGAFIGFAPLAGAGFKSVGGQVAPLSSFVPSVPKVTLPRVATAVNTAIESALSPIGSIMDIASARSITAREMFGLSKGYTPRAEVIGSARPLYQKMFGTSFKESAEAKWWREPTQAYTQAQFTLYHPFESPLGRTLQSTPTEVLDVRPQLSLGEKMFGRFDVRTEIKDIVGEPTKPAPEGTPMITKMFGRGREEPVDIRGVVPARPELPPEQVRTILTGRLTSKTYRDVASLVRPVLADMGMDVMKMTDIGFDITRLPKGVLGVANPEGGISLQANIAGWRGVITMPHEIAHLTQRTGIVPSKFGDVISESTAYGFERQFINKFIDRYGYAFPRPEHTKQIMLMESGKPSVLDVMSYKDITLSERLYEFGRAVPLYFGKYGIKREYRLTEPTPKPIDTKSMITKMFGQAPVKDRSTQWWREPNEAYTQARFEKFNVFTAEGRALGKPEIETIDVTPQLSFREKAFGAFSVRQAIKDMTRITPYPPKPEKPDIIDVRPLTEKMFGSPKKEVRTEDYWREPTPAYESGQFDIYNPLKSGRKLAKPEVTFVDAHPWYEKAFGISKKTIDAWWKDPLSPMKHITSTGAARARAYQEWYANMHPVEGGERVYVAFNPKQAVRLPTIEFLAGEKKTPVLKIEKDLTQELHKKWGVREKDLEKQMRSGEYGMTKEGQVVLTKQKLEPKVKEKTLEPKMKEKPPEAMLLTAPQFIETNLHKRLRITKSTSAQRMMEQMHHNLAQMSGQQPIVGQKQKPFTTTKPAEIVIPKMGTTPAYKPTQLPALELLEKLVQKEIAIQRPRLETPTVGRVITPEIIPPPLNFGEKVFVKKGRKVSRRATGYEIRNVFAGLRDLIGG